MNIKITSTTTLTEIKESFNKEFPFLKIEFFRTGHSVGEANAGYDLITENIPVGKLNKDLTAEILSIRPVQSVASLEQAFQQLGLPIQVFRKQKNVWLETTKTDKLTLFHQNSIGKEASAPVAPAEPADRYLEDGQY